MNDREAELRPLSASDRGVTPDESALQSWVQAALSVAGETKAEVAVAVVAPDAMAGLNRRFRGMEGATCSLAFPASGTEAPSKIRFLGDIALCAAVIRQQAADWNMPERDHWAHMCIHGTLHLLGYDHSAPDEARRMEQLESRAMRSLGLTDPWRDEAAFRWQDERQASR